MEIVEKLIIFEILFREIFIVDAICAIGPTNDSYTSILNDIFQAIKLRNRQNFNNTNLI